MVMLLILVKGPCVCSLLFVVFGLLFVLTILVSGLLLGSHGRSLVLVGGVVLLKLGTPDVEGCLAGTVDSDVYIFVADVVKSFDTVDRGVLDCILSSLGVASLVPSCFV